MTVDGAVTGAIGPGLLVLLGVTHTDTEADADRLAEKVRNLRVFADADGRMNEPLGEREVLCVSQFTLYGDTRKGNRPAYVDAARPEVAEPLYERFCERLDAQRGVFGAHMDVELVNDGPVTRDDRGAGQLGARLPRADRRICRFAAEPPQGRAAARRRRPCRPSSSPPACGSRPRRTTPSSAPPARSTGSPTAPGRAAPTCPRPTRTDTGLELFGYVSFAPGDEAERALRLGRLHAPTSPRTTPSGGWTSPRRSSAAGAASAGWSPR